MKKTPNVNPICAVSLKTIQPGEARYRQACERPCGMPQDHEWGTIITSPTSEIVRSHTPLTSRFFCVACLAAFLRDTLGTAYTKGQIERA
jgi:hypothetical protein